MIVINDNSALSCLAEIGELDLLRVLYGKVTDAAAAGLIDFEDVFLRLSQTGFRLSAQVVETLRQDLAKRFPPA